MNDNSKIKVPSFHNEWKEEFERIKPQLIELIQNSDNVHVILSYNPPIEALHYIVNSSYVPNLIHISDKTIITREFNDDLINLIQENLNDDTQTMTVNANSLNDPNFINKLRKLRNLHDLYIIDDITLTPEMLNKISSNSTNGLTIHTKSADKTIIDDLPDAIKYNGDFQATYYDNLLIIDDRSFDSKVQLFHTGDILYNLSTIFDFIRHNNINTDNNRINIISVGQYDEQIYYISETNTLEYHGNTQDIEYVIEQFETNGKPVDTLIMDINNLKCDIEPLTHLNKQVYINYTDYFYDMAPLEDFETVRATFKYYKDLIQAYPLSPIEQVTFAYDLIKSFNDEDDKSQSRKMHNIFKSGKIVCVGYAKILTELLKELGFKIEVLEVESDSENKSEGNFINPRYNHTRCIIRIDDDKYNIHGVFALDPTWDRNMDRYEVKDKHGSHPTDEIPKKYTKKYEDIISYIHFLVTKNEYQAIYEDRHMPAVFGLQTKKLVDNLEDKPRLSSRVQSFIDEGSYMLQCLFDEDEYDKIEDYMSTERPSLDIFEEILYNVKKAEGYTQEETKHNLDDIEQYNRSLYQYSGTPLFTNYKPQEFTQADIKPKQK